MLKTFASGKVILSGEYSVVYGEPALVTTVKLGIWIKERRENESDKELKLSPYLRYIYHLFTKQHSIEFDDLLSLTLFVNSSLPQKSGLGSSASFASAVFQFLFSYFKVNYSKQDLYHLVYLAENFIHTNSSGVDPSAVVFGGLQVFIKEKKRFSRINLNIKKGVLPQLFLINSGLAFESTGELVSLVSSRMKKDFRIKKVVKDIGSITNEMISELKRDKFNIQLIQQNQKLLDKLGVVGDRAKEIVGLVERIGGVAKVTGAGGIKTGSGYLLSYHPCSNTLIKLLKEQQLEYFVIN